MHPREVAIVGALVLFLLVPWLTARDVWRQPTDAWAEAGRSRWVWTVVVVLLPVLGSLWYLRVVRPGVQWAGRSPRSQQQGRE